MSVNSDYLEPLVDLTRIESKSKHSFISHQILNVPNDVWIMKSNEGIIILIRDSSFFSLYFFGDFPFVKSDLFNVQINFTRYFHILFSPKIRTPTYSTNMMID